MAQESSTEVTKPQPRRRWWRWMIVVLALIAVGAVVASVLMRSPEVLVVAPEQRPVVEALTVSGRVAGIVDSELAPKQPGIVTSLLVEEGSQVAAGQVVARLADDVLSAEMRQASAAVMTARAQVAEARAQNEAKNPRVREVETAAVRQVDEAQARLEQARLRLRELQAGGTAAQRAEAAAAVQEARERVALAEREVAWARSLAESESTANADLRAAEAAYQAAQAQVGQAEAELAEATRERQRLERLVTAGAAAQASLDGALTREQQAREALVQARARLESARVEVERQRTLLVVTRRQSLQRAEGQLAAARETLRQAQARQQQVQEPARPEIVDQAQAEIAAARTAVENARANRSAGVQAARAEPTEERVSVARRRLQEAERALRSAAARRRKAVLEAPYSGTVVEVLRRPGDVIAANQPLLRIADLSRVEVRVDVDERDLARIDVGQRAVLISDVRPEVELSGEVAEIAPAAAYERGTVEVKVRVLSPPAWLRTGMTMDATIILAPEQQLLLIPTSAVQRENDKTFVLVAQEGRLERREINIGQAEAEGIVVTSGLSVSDQVVTDPTGLQAGQEVRPEPPSPSAQPGARP